MANKNRERIAPLSDLNDFEVAENDPDVRGWDVIAADGRKIGDVKDLIVDQDAMKVRYLDVEIDKDFRADDNRRVLIPVGQAQLHEREDHVHVNRLSSADARDYPAYSGRFDRSYENEVHRRFDSGAGSTSGSEYYAHTNFDDDRFYGSRRSGTRPSTERGSSHRSSVSGRETARSDRDARHDERGSRSDRMTLSEEKVDVSKRAVDEGGSRG
jgi:photosynthetic reaction center H subunit